MVDLNCKHINLRMKLGDDGYMLCKNCGMRFNEFKDVPFYNIYIPTISLDDDPGKFNGPPKF